MVPQDKHQPSNGWISTSRHLKTTGLLGYIHPCPNGICTDRLIIQKAKYKVRFFNPQHRLVWKQLICKMLPLPILNAFVNLVLPSFIKVQLVGSNHLSIRWASMKSCTPLDSSSTSCRQGVNGWFRSGCNRLNCCWMYLKKASGVGNQEAFLSWKMLWKCFLLKIGLKDLQS